MSLKKDFWKEEKEDKFDKFLSWLMVWGWLILVIVFTLGSLLYFGVIPNNSSFHPACECPEKCEVIGSNNFNQISCCETAVYDNHKCSLIYQSTRFYRDGSVENGININNLTGDFYG